MFRKVAIIGLLVIATLAAPAWARLPETPRLRQLTVADGLPSNVIHALAGDRSGYLWIGTADGLARYDGVGFRVWRKEDGLPANAVSALHVDADDRLWIATTAGLVLLDREHRRLRPVPDRPGRAPAAIHAGPGGSAQPAVGQRRAAGHRPCRHPLGRHPRRPRAVDGRRVRDGAWPGGRAAPAVAGARPRREAVGRHARRGRGGGRGRPLFAITALAR